MLGSAVRGVTPESEDSIRLRLVVLATVMVAVTAVVAQGAVDSATALAAYVLIPGGYAFSYFRRDKKNFYVKVVLAIGMLAALGAFLNGVRFAPSVDAARQSLASLFLWVQVLHGFDLPRRRDLSFSIGASLALMAEAASLSLSSTFGLFLVPYATLGAMWLYLSHRSQTEEAAARAKLRRPPGEEAGRGLPMRLVAVTAVIAILSAFLVFLFVPRLPGQRIVAPPFSLTQRLGVPGFNGSVVNPGLPSESGGGGSAFSPFAYPGFGSSIDLRARGQLSDLVVMKVRASQPAFWRAQVYDTFDGTAWTTSDESTVRVFGGTPLQLPPADGAENSARFRPLVQTFYVQEQQPNIAFAAYRPIELYFPANGVEVDRYGSIRTPIFLEDGLIYSVVSQVPLTTPAMLRQANGPYDAAAVQQYTQFPSDVPDRVVRLAHEITDGQPTTYDKVMAVQRWLQANTKYNLDIPPDPPGVDAVDYFLFERREGFCEHIASSMAILLRAAGIPARFAVGFDSGERNPFTGYFEVRESDAHSWVEVDYPGIGWVEYDPTHAVPAADPGAQDTFIAPEVLKAIGRFFVRVVPEPVKDLGRDVASGVAYAARGAAHVWPVSLAVVLLLAAAAYALKWWRSKRRRGPPLTGAAAAFVSMCETFAERGHARSPERTPREHLRSLLREDELAKAASADVERIVRTFERARYAPGEPDQNEVGESLEAAVRIRERAELRA